MRPEHDHDKLARGGTLAPFLRNYLAQARGTDIEDALRSALERVDRLLGHLSEERSLYRYAEGKWSIREMLQHMNDTERIFAYRALRIAREDGTPLPAFEEDAFAAASRADQRTLHSILKEHHLIRQGTIALYGSFDERMLMQEGSAGGNVVSVRALGLLIAGHAEHHCGILEQRYR